MDTFVTKFLDGHIVVNINRFDYVVDTGSPMSFGRGTSISINGKHFPINDAGSIGVTADSLSTLSGLKLDGLIGMDILHHFDIRLTQNQITFSNTPLSYADSAIKLPIVDTVMGIPIIILNIGDTDRRIFFDTGAKLSYLSEELLVGTSVGEMEDFYPSIGTFKTNIYKTDVNIGGNNKMLTFGLLPSSIRMLLELGKTKGILGTELLNDYSIVLSNLNKTLILELANDETSVNQQRHSYSRELSLD